MDKTYGSRAFGFLLAAGIGFGTMGFARDACAHDPYTNWMRTDTGGSCCNDQDCRQATARFNGNSWEVMLEGKWVDVPPGPGFGSKEGGEPRRHASCVCEPPTAYLLFHAGRSEVLGRICMNLFVRKNATLKARPILGRVQFQYRPGDQEKPLESGEPIDFGGDIDRVDLPLVGDFVHLPSQGISGIVESRLFWYVQNGSNTSYLVNIVVTDTEVELTKLINVESAA